MAAIIDRAEVEAPACNPAARARLERSDDEIAKDALTALRSNLCVPAERIMVIVMNGLVTLEGCVEFRVQKMLAEAAVKRLRGITGVHNRIEARPEDFMRAPKIVIEEEMGD